jgi:hypothetical protein
MPRALSYTLAAIGLSWLTYSLILGIESLSHTKLQYGPLGIIIAGAALIGLGLFWHISRIGANETAASRDNSGIGELLLECQLAALPEVGPPSQSMLFVVSPFRFTELGTIGYTTAPSEPGKPLPWPQEWKNKRASSAICRVTNYGKTTLFNVEVAFKITFVQITRGENPGSSIGNTVINVEDGVIPITKLEPGSDGAYVFYILNQGRDIVHPRFAESATCLPQGAATRTSVKVIQPADVMHHADSIWPIRDPVEILNEADAAKSRPAPPPPTPAQPDKPAGK